MTTPEEERDQQHGAVRAEQMIALPPEIQIALIEQKRQLAIARYDLLMRRGMMLNKERRKSVW